MESLQALKSRLRAVKNIGQITKAMEVVAATKMRRSQEVALGSRPYAFQALELLEKLSRFAPLETFLTGVRPVKNTLAVIIASDRGLAGSFNTQVFRAADNFFATDNYRNNPQHRFLIAAIGKKAEIYASKSKLPVAGKFYGFGDFIEPQETEPLAQLVVKGFENKDWDRVVTISTHFRTALKQEILVRQLLPVDFQKIGETVREIIPEHGRYAELNKITSDKRQAAKVNIEYIFEPSPEETLNILIHHLVKMQIYHIILEANASEHSARRVAMKNASDNADELSYGFTIQYNKARQAAITNEMIEIASTQSALI